MSFMRRHQKQVWAKQAHTSTAKANTEAYRREYKQWLGKMRGDQTAVKDFTDHSDRNAKAAEVVNGYLDYLKDWIAQGFKHQNDVLTQAVVWSADGERWDILFDLADYAIANPKVGNLHWMKRDLGDFVADIVLKTASAEKDTESDIKAPVQQVLERIRDDRWQVNHIVKARYLKFCGIQAEEQKDWETAAELLSEAHETYPQIGVKGKRDQAIAQRDAAKNTVKAEANDEADNTAEPKQKENEEAENT